jgi:hypothetical protein
MASTQYFFSGTAEWAKVFEHNKDNFRGKTYFSIDVIVSDKEAERFKATGTGITPKKDAEGVTRLPLRRNEDNPVNEEWGGPPKVIIENPSEPGSYIDFEDVYGKGALIGNGSEVTVKITVYDTKAFGKGTRLDVVRVDKLVEFGGTKVDTSGPDIGVPF